MALRNAIQYKGLHPANTLREVSVALKTSNRETISEWHGRFAPQHFKESAVAKYGYRNRTAKYRRRKMRIKGHDRPLEWSGRTKRNALRQVVITGTSKAARGRLPGTNTLNFKPGGIDMRAELLSTTSREETTLTTFHETTVANQLNGVRATKTVRI